MPRIPMDWKEINEGRRAGIPEYVLRQMALGLELTKREENTLKELVRGHGKEYVSAHKRNGNWVKPHLRDLNGGRKTVKIPKKKTIDDELEYLYEKTQLEVYDSGDEFMDRYTIRIGEDVYGMSENATSPMGFNQYSGEASEFTEFFTDNIDNRLSKRDLSKLPEQTKKAILNRYQN